MIKLQVIGHLGKDAIVNTVSGKTVINFSVAHSEKVKDAQGQQIDKTVWVECAYWTEKTAVAPYLKKGTQVFAEGTGDLRNYTTQDGRAGTTLALRVATVQLLGTKQENGSNNTYQPNQAPQQQQQQQYQQPAQPQYQQQQNYNSPPNNMQPAPLQASDLVEPLDDLPF